MRTAVWPENHPRDFVYLDTHARHASCGGSRSRPIAQRDKRDYTPETACPCPQIYFDPILGDHARTFPNVTFAYNTRLDSFSQDDDGVTAQVTDMATGAARTLRAQYLIGCDGPSGVVREALGIGIEGLGAIARSVNLFFRSAELATSHDKGWARFYRVIDETGCWAELIPIDGKELWRLTVFDEPLSAADPDFLLRKLAGGPFAYEMLNVSPWERRDYVARSYGQGRVFIAGDSAHECSPTGGIGMHMGLEEAVNLGWKLAALAEGWGGPALLASYEIERRPIAVRNVELATQTYNAIAAIPGWRDGIDRLEGRSGLAVDPRAHEARTIATKTRRSACRTARPAPGDDPKQFVPSTRPGTRAPHAWLDDDRSTLDLFGDGFVLLRLGANPPDATPLFDAARRAACRCARSPSPTPMSPRCMRRRWCWCGRTAMSPGAATNARPTPARIVDAHPRRGASRSKSAPSPRTEPPSSAVAPDSARICYSGRNSPGEPHERDRHADDRPAAVPTRTSARPGTPRTCARCGRARSRTRPARAVRRRTIGAGSRSGRWWTTP